MTRRSPERVLLGRMPKKYQRATSLVAREFGITSRELLSPTRGSPHVAKARQVLMYILHTVYGESYTSVGLLLGRYRKTVSHGVESTTVDRCIRDLDAKVQTIEREVP